MNSPPTKTGSVKWFNPGRGFGFICPDGPDAEEIYFPTASIVDAANPGKGDRVQFVVGRNRSGAPCAKNVKILS
jgi:cold shock CspA family protein